MTDQRGDMTPGRNRAVWRVAFLLLAVPATFVVARRAWGGEAKPSQGETDSATLDVEWNPDERPEAREHYVASRFLLLQSKAVLEAALAAHPEILGQLQGRDREDPMTWLAGGLGFERLPGTDFIRVSFRAPSRPTATMVVKAVVQAFLAHSRREDEQPVERQIDALREERFEAENDLNRLRRLIQDHDKKTAKLGALPSGPGLEVEGLKAVREELRRVQLARKGAEVRLSRRKAAKEPKASEVEALEEEVAVLAAQEDLLAEGERKGVEALRDAEAASISTRYDRDEWARAEARLFRADDRLARIAGSSRAGNVPAYARIKVISD